MKPPMFVVFTAVLLWSCAQAARSTWTSAPSAQEISAPTYTIQVAPQKHGNPFYVSFRVTIQNHGRQPLEIDWNRTRYLHNGKDLGVFVFRGIDPDSIKGAIPSDIVPAGKAFSKEIFPLRTIAFLPRSKYPEPGRLGFTPGILPAGDNAIHLVWRQDDHQLRKTITLRLTESPAKP